FNAATDPSEGSNNALEMLCASADGRTIYAFLKTNANVFPSTNDLLLVTLDTATNAMKQVYKQTNYAGGLNSGVTAEGGRYLYLCTFNLGGQTPDQLGGISVMDTKSFAIVQTYPWTSEFL